jgi:signal transduction histidine kinase
LVSLAGIVLDNGVRTVLGLLLESADESFMFSRLASEEVAVEGFAFATFKSRARNMALFFRPSMLDDFGLVPALNWQARETAKRTGWRVQVTAAELGELPEEHKTCIYRVVQEAKQRDQARPGERGASARATLRPWY